MTHMVTLSNTPKSVVPGLSILVATDPQPQPQGWRAACSRLPGKRGQLDRVAACLKRCWWQLALPMPGGGGGGGGGGVLIATERGNVPHLQMQGQLDRIPDVLPALQLVGGQLAHLVVEGQPAHLVVEGQPAHLVVEGQPAHLVVEGQPALLVVEGQPALLVVEGQPARIARTGHPSRVGRRSTLPLASSSPFLYLPVLTLGSMPQRRERTVSNTTYHVKHGNP